MPIKKDGTGKRWVEMEFLVPGTPEQVWHAMATGPGNAAWFVKGEIEPRLGGAFKLDFGGGAVSNGEVTTWQPPHAMGYVERDWAPGAPDVATEITIIARSGDTCLVRMVHSLFTSSDDWDDQMEGFESGWPGFFAVLRVYLGHFAGADAASFILNHPADSESLTAWHQLGRALDLTNASSGERRTTASGPEHWSGVVERVHQDAQQRWVVLRVESPAPGVLLVGTHDAGGSTTVSVCRYYYGDNVTTLGTEGEAAWRAWVSEQFPGPAT